ncbi:sensor histidine kinase [Saccharibacillus sacchari]|uniref:sensor histidine kinase n=1 Tax=Saccharibacillus sacchari TaxID=456493 RepID=UPI0004B17FAA|nr:HAMP domain-containing sensor histidine kinase [Saccharibacillus sacchari]
MKNNKAPLSEELEAERKAADPAKKTKSKIKMKFPPIHPWFIRAVLLGIVAAFVIMQYPSMQYRAADWTRQETSDISLNLNEPRDWIEYMQKANYVLPFTLAQQNWRKDQAVGVVPADILLPGGWNAYNSYPSGAPIPESFKNRFDALVMSWQSKMMGGGTALSDMQYMVKHEGTGQRLINGSDWLGLLDTVYNEELKTKLSEDYAFYALIRFDWNGSMSIPIWYGLPDSWKDRMTVNQLNRQDFVSGLGRVEPSMQELSAIEPYIKRIEAPSEFTMVYALPRGSHSSLSSLEPYYGYAMEESGFKQIALLALGCAVLIGLLPLERKSRAPRLPLEFWLFGAVLPILFYIEFARYSYVVAEAFRSGESVVPITLAICVWMWTLIFWCGSAWFLMMAFRRGFGSSLAEGSLAVRAFNGLHTFDPSSRSDRSLIKLTAAHFLILAAIVSSAVWIWFYALIPLAVYLLVLLYLFKKQKDRLRQDYARLFDSVRLMAQGNLGIEIDGRMGMFDPLKQELQKVREGFKRAVDEETKSQKMKSELVTNVSHDLKTPVTAILTYVNLLQQADLPEEDRKAYIEVLSGKSQRLSRLIEDLFEYTRASSGNTEIAPVSVDLAELLKQARIELEDPLTEAGVQLRLRLPEHKVIVPLDSEKTFRVFENLYLNIAKYAAPGSRAHIELTELEHEVVVSFKNVSAAELDFKADEITERFVRGDRSRHTEGSGLGLAIVKSLVELQGGTFDLQLDGDLFKAVIRWPMPKRSLETNDVSD